MSKWLLCGIAMFVSVLVGCGAQDIVPAPGGAAGAPAGKKEVVGQWVFDIEATVNQFPENPLAGPYRAATPEKQQEMQQLAAAKPFMEFFDDGRAVVAIGTHGGAGMKGKWSWNGTAYLVKLEEKGEDPSFTYRDGKLSGGGNANTMAVFVKRS